MRDIIAKEAGVSHGTIDKFKYIEKHAEPKRVDALCNGNRDEKGKQLSIDGVYLDTIRKKTNAEIISNLESTPNYLSHGGLLLGFLNLLLLSCFWIGCIVIFYSSSHI